MAPEIGLKKEDIEKIIWNVIDEFLIPNFNENDMNATGEWIATLEARVETSDGKVRGEIWGRDYTEGLVNGQPPGTFVEVHKLERWAIHKFGMFGDDARNFAYAVQRNIYKRGTNSYPMGTNLLEVLEKPEVIEYVQNQVKGEYIKSVRSEIMRNFRKLENGN